MGPQNNPAPDSNPLSDEAPQAPVVEEASAELAEAAKIATSKPFKTLKEHMEQRIQFYQQFLPNGDNILGEKNVAELGYNWVAANAIVAEFRSFLNAYEGAAQQLKDLKSGNGQ